MIYCDAYIGERCPSLAGSRRGWSKVVMEVHMYNCNNCTVMLWSNMYNFINLRSPTHGPRNSQSLMMQTSKSFMFSHPGMMPHRVWKKIPTRRCQLHSTRIFHLWRDFLLDPCLQYTAVCLSRRNLVKQANYVRSSLLRSELVWALYIQNRKSRHETYSSELIHLSAVYLKGSE